MKWASSIGVALLSALCLSACASNNGVATPSDAVSNVLHKKVTVESLMENVYSLDEAHYMADETTVFSYYMKNSSGERVKGMDVEQTSSITAVPTLIYVSSDVTLTEPSSGASKTEGMQYYSDGDTRYCYTDSWYKEDVEEDNDAVGGTGLLRRLPKYDYTELELQPYDNDLSYYEVTGKATYDGSEYEINLKFDKETSQVVEAESSSVGYFEQGDFSLGNLTCKVIVKTMGNEIKLDLPDEAKNADYKEAK